MEKALPVEKPVEHTELEIQQSQQITEQQLIIGALEASNRLLTYRVDLVFKQNQKLQEEIKALKTPATPEPTKK